MNIGMMEHFDELVTQQADDGLVVLLSGVRDGLADEALIEQLTRSLAQEEARALYPGAACGNSLFRSVLPCARQESRQRPRPCHRTLDRRAARWAD